MPDREGESAWTHHSRKFRAWRRAIRAFLSYWKRRHLWRLVGVILAVWIVAATFLHFTDRDNPGFATWGESLWNVWVILFSGVNSPPTSFAGRLLTSLLVVAGVALAGLFTASIAAVLIEQSLRRRQVTTLEMSDHLVVCNWSSGCLELIREVHSSIVHDKRPVVIIHDNPDEVELPDKQDDPAFHDVYIVKGDPANEIILRRAKVAQAHSVVVLADDRQGPHADGKTIVCCIAIKNVCTSKDQPNVVVECRDPKYRAHLRKAGADEVISAAEFGLRLLARASLFHGMTRVYQELLTVGRDANEMYLIPVAPWMVGMEFVALAERFLRDRDTPGACMLIGLYRGERMMLNPIRGEAGPLREGDELILLSTLLPDLARMRPTEGR